MALTVSIPRVKITTIVSSLALVTLTIVLFSLSVGAVAIPVKDVTIILLQKIGLFTSVETDSTHTIVLETIRLPRVLMTLLIGAALGVSGASLQGLFRNPLVEPSLIGVSGGSAAAVVCVIVFGSSLAVSLPSILYNSIIPIVAFAGGLVATLVVVRLSDQSGKTNMAVLVLIGVAMNALTGAIVGMAIFFADENQLRTFTFWTLGDLGGATWDKLLISAPMLAGSTIILSFYTKALNALALGESEAFHMGVDVEKVKRILIFFSALAVGVSVSLAGIIGFIGLVVPHLIRVCFQPDHKLVLPASIFGGASLLLIADLVARTVVAPAELPIGVVTALIGAPFFIALLLKAKSKNEI